MNPTIVKPDYPPVSGTPAMRDLSVVTAEIVHHSAGPLTETPLDIDAQHRAQGWDMIGYSYVIDPKGVIYQGRPLDMVPAAAEGHNKISVDICLIGNFQSDDAGYTGPPTPAQIRSLEELSVWLHMPEQGLALDITLGHRDVNSTACPGNVLYQLLPQIKNFTWSHLPH